MNLIARRLFSGLTLMVTFGIAYFGASLVWFPGALRSTTAAAQLLFPPSLHHESEPTAHPPGTSLDLPIMMLLEGDGAFNPPPGPLAVTVFDVSCEFSSKSVPFWRRAQASLSRAGVANVFATCAPTVDDARSFARNYADGVPLYYLGDCGNVATSLKMELKIVQYVLDERRRVVSAWGGMPLYRYAENNVIAQMINAATRRW